MPFEMSFRDFPASWLLVASACAIGVTASSPAVDTSACASAKSLSAEYASASPEAANAKIPVQVAVDCLQSVPLDAAGNIKLLDEYGLFLEWQSNSAWLAKPPASSNEPREDVLLGINEIKRNLTDGVFKTEWDFQTALFKTVLNAYDTHLRWIPDISTVFTFTRDAVALQMVSVSWDGTELPELYILSDMNSAAKEVNGARPSPVQLINGGDAIEYMKQFALQNPLHDRDARFNTLLYSQPSLAFGPGLDNTFLQQRLPYGDSTSVQFRNGTVLTFQNTATVLRSLERVVDGPSFFANFCTGPPETLDKPRFTTLNEGLESGGSSLTLRQETKGEGKAPVATSYPTPVEIHSQSLVAGFFLEGDGYDDTAVLAIPSFNAITKGSKAEFRNTVGAFFDKITEQGKSRLIIDLRNNGGGEPYLGVDIWKRLYPDISEPYDSNRFRAHPANQQISRIINDFIDKSQLTPEQALDDLNSSTSNQTLAEPYSSVWNYRVPLTSEDGAKFSSQEQFYGPYAVNGDFFTSIWNWNVSSPFTNYRPIVIGYGALAGDLKPAPVRPESIVILNDGNCLSACAIFSELMKSQGRAEVVVLGGEPRTGPMQAVGGTKGGFTWSLQNIRNIALAAIAYGSQNDSGAPDEELSRQLRGTALGALANAYQPIRRGYTGPLTGMESYINVFDKFRKGDHSQTPLEFIYEAADCRLFYTPEMIANVTNVWKIVRDVKWRDGYKGCVEGSTFHPSSLSGGAFVNGVKPEDTKPPPPGNVTVPPYRGPNNTSTPVFNRARTLSPQTVPLLAFNFLVGLSSIAL